jgi:S-adenosylmethionine-diacylgycerolhomoserine-N-methlytransferase
VPVLLTAADEMDRMYRYQRYIYDLTRKYYLLGRDGLIDRLQPGVGGRVLEIGCGTGRNLILAARRYPDARFFGVDVSAEMLASARYAISRARLVADVRVAQADATALRASALFGEAELERVFISYSLSMIPAWRAVLDTALSLLAPGGELHIVDFGGQERLPAWFRDALRRWLALFHVMPCDELQTALTDRATRVNASLSVTRPYGGYAQYALVKMPG